LQVIEIVKPRLAFLIAATFLFAFRSAAVAAPEWEGNLTKDPPGNFPPLKPVHTTYHFGWSGITAGAGDIRFSRTDKHFELDAAGKTIGFVRALWKLDASYRGLVDSDMLRPIESKQTETYRKKKLITDLAFTNSGVVRTRTEVPASGKTSIPVPFNFPGLFDLHSAWLYLRSQPLTDHSTYRIAVYPATSAYLTTLTVLGHEHVSVRAGNYNAIKLDLQLKRVGKKMELEPHRKFRRATIWISDDENRIPLRIEAQIFVGTVFAELQTVRFDPEKS